MASLFSQPYITPSDYDTVEFPSKKEIMLAQSSAAQENERSLLRKANASREEPQQHVDAGGMIMMNNAVWIPERAVELQLRLYEEAHCFSAGHRAYEATLGAIKACVAWATMAKDVKVFVQSCLHCVATITGDKMPRLLVRSYMRPSPTRFCISTSCTLGCQEMESNSTNYFSRMA
jgi:hypothetical protein